jgi:predicted ABC-type ATPase
VPNIVVIAGPNGAGKSTSAPRLLGERLKIAEFVNADVIAAGLSAFDPERVALKAGTGGVWGGFRLRNHARVAQLRVMDC